MGGRDLDHDRSGLAVLVSSHGADWLSYPDAVERVLAAARPGPEESVVLEQALGRVLARPLHSRATLPPHDNSAMDGYAVRSAQLAGSGPPISLSVANESLPGSLPLTDVPEGVAVRIMTGGPLPEGFDSIIRVEHTDGEQHRGTVVLHTLDDLGKHVRPGGRDFTRGEIALSAGTRLTPAGLANAAAAGHDPVHVHARPRVGVLSSGDELRGVGEFERVIGGEGVPDSNRPMLLALVDGVGGDPVDLGVVRDAPESIAAVLSGLPTLDALVTIGGASMGERDLLKHVMGELGFEQSFWRVKIRPGSPFSFGHLPRGEHQLPVFGLPGNPASAFVTFHLFVAPFLQRTLGGRPPATAPVVTARALESFRSPARLTHFFRVALSQSGAAPELCCRPTGPQGSGLVSPLQEAGGLAMVPEGVENVDEGALLSVLLLPGARIAAADPTGR